MDHCTLSPEGFLGVDWSMSCYAHDGRYEQGKTLWEKIKADFLLALDIWAIASLADAYWKTVIIRIYAVGVFLATSTFGIFFWLVSRLGDKGK